MTNEELILQKLTTLEEKYDKEFGQLKESNVKLEKATDLIAITVVNLETKAQKLDERSAHTDTTVTTILNNQDDLYKKYEILNDERLVMNKDMKVLEEGHENHEERIVRLETTMNLKTAV